MILELPNGRFFTPTKHFIDQILPVVCKKKVYEAGAGDGMFASILSSHQVDITALDLHCRPIEIP